MSCTINQSPDISSLTPRFRRTKFWRRPKDSGRDGATFRRLRLSSVPVMFFLPFRAILSRKTAFCRDFRMASEPDGRIMSVRAIDRPGAFVPLAGGSVTAGFPSPADDYLDRALDFNELLIENPAATFAVRIAGESMTGAGMFPGDIAVINRARTPTSGSVVLALVNGDFTVKRYRVRAGRVILQAENPAYPDIEIRDGTEFEVWGVVSHSIRSF